LSWEPHGGGCHEEAKKAPASRWCDMARTLCRDSFPSACMLYGRCNKCMCFPSTHACQRLPQSPPIGLGHSMRIDKVHVWVGGCQEPCHAPQLALDSVRCAGTAYDGGAPWRPTAAPASIVCTSASCILAAGPRATAWPCLLAHACPPCVVNLLREHMHTPFPIRTRMRPALGWTRLV